ncbi:MULTISPECIES: hypothetical protein [unclassified Streptomyces]
MLDTTLPVHVLTGLSAVGWRKPRPGEEGPQPIWPILGGDGTGDGDGSDGDGSDTTDDGDDQDGDDGQDAEDGEDQDLGEKGQKALRALRRENRTLKAQLKRAGTGAGDGAQKPAKGDKDAGGDGDQVDPEAIRQKARDEARAEVWTERVESAAVAAAAGRLANPQLAARLLDLADIGQDAKGRPDKTALKDLIDELLEEEPYLAAKSAKDEGGRRFEGGADGGARKTTKTAATLGDAVAAHFAGKSG